MTEDPRWRLRVSCNDDRAVCYLRKSRIELGAPLSFDAEYPQVTALEQVLAAIAGDLAMGFWQLARRRRLQLDHLEATIDGTLHQPLAYLGVVGCDGDPGLKAASVKLYVDTLETEETVRQVFADSLTRSPLYNTFRSAIALDVELVFAVDQLTQGRTMTKPLLMGCVIYDPKVSIIWDIIRDYFEAQSLPLDVVYYTNYELQVTAHLAGHLDIAWNSPLAWVDAQLQSHNQCRAIAMRDTDRDRCSHVIVNSDSGISSVADLAGKTIGFGAKDSPQATLIPREHLLRAGLALEAYQVQRFDKLVGKHGDHIGGELDAFRALERGEVAASCLLDLNWDSWTADGTIDPQRYRILSTTGRFDHCVFTVRGDFPQDRERAFLDVLFSMDYSNPDHREMMDLEGLKAWEAGRVSGFELLSAACEHQRFFQER